MDFNETKTENTPAASLPLGRLNFMGVAAVLIVAGFLLMLGSSSTPQEFNPDIFSTRRIVVGPAIAFIGFVAMALAIIIKPTCKNKANGHA
jgi:hypothetical protein